MLRKTAIEVAEERPARRKPFTEAEVRELLASVDEVVVARGKRVETRPAKDVGPRDLLGPTGNYRAPMLRVGRRLLVGFHAETLERFVL